MTLPVPETLEVLPLAAFNDNYIWLIAAAPVVPTARSDTATAGAAVDDIGFRDAIVVDPGQAEPVIAALAARKLRLSAILLTHHHADHVGGVASLLAYAGADIPVYGPAGESIEHVSVPLAQGDAVSVAALNAHFTVIDVPGHTRGHIAYVMANADSAPSLFCGDTLFACGCGRLFEGTPAQMLASLDKLAALPDDTLVYCAHEYTLSNIRFALACDGNNPDLLVWRDEATALRAKGGPTLPTTMAHERRVNPFLRVEQEAIISRLAEQSGSRPANRLDAFTALRAWKDRF